VVKALVIIDMLDDFVGGALVNPRARAIVPSLKRILEPRSRLRLCVLLTGWSTHYSAQLFYIVDWRALTTAVFAAGKLPLNPPRITRRLAARMEAAGA